jgi:hypothetical protein
LQQQEAGEDVSGQSTKESGESTTDDSEKGVMQLFMMISVVDLSPVDWAEKKCVNFPNSEDSLFSLACHNKFTKRFSALNQESQPQPPTHRTFQTRQPLSRQEPAN